MEINVDDHPLRKKMRIQHVLVLVAVLVLLSVLLTASGPRSLTISEVMTSNRGSVSDEDGDHPDWLELHNASRKPVDLGVFWLSNDPAVPLKWPLPSMTLPPGGYLLIFASGKDRRDLHGPFPHTNFRLSAEGVTLVLSTEEKGVFDSVDLGPIFTNVSAGRSAKNPAKWLLYLTPTPGKANTSPGVAEIVRTPALDVPVRVNEILSVNRTSVVDHDGDLSDWIELRNTGREPWPLGGYWLSDKADNPFRWRFPDVTIGPGEYLLVFASGKDRRAPGDELHTNFRLSRDGDQLVFSTDVGRIIDEIDLRRMIADVSYGRPERAGAGDGDSAGGSSGALSVGGAPAAAPTAAPDTWLYFPVPTPGQPNTTQGFPELSGQTLNQGHNLRINEVMTLNQRTLADENGDWSDWVEIYNAGEESVNLAGFGLSDRPDAPHRWVFPPVTLEPKTFLLVFASGKDRTDPNRRLHTNFRLGTSGETVILADPRRTIIDTLTTGKLVADMSSGRYPDGAEGRFFFLRPSPGRPNDPSDLAGYAPAPLFSAVGGFYDAPLSLALSLPVGEVPSASGEVPLGAVEAPSAAGPGSVIRYTLDGAEPTTTSPVYDGPIPIDGTVVVRARTFAPGLLPSPAVNHSYFINDRPTVAVLSIMMNPADLWDYRTGIYVAGPNASDVFPYKGANYWMDMEKPMHMQFFEPDGRLGLSRDLGIEIGGQYSRAMPQKTFNIFARDRYGSDVMEYPFFPGYELTTFKSLTLRTANQDATLTKMRDIMMSSLLDETDLDYQRYRISVVYLNGEYWGLYNIRERANEYFVAYKHDVDPTKVDLLQANWTVREGNRDDYMELWSFVRSHDMRKPENYEYVKTRMDVDNYIDYLSVQIFCANTDSANIRFWRERTDGARWRWIVYDLDWGFFSLTHNTLAALTNPQGTGWAGALNTVLTWKLMQNEEFRRQFIQRLAYHLNCTFATPRVLARIDEIAAVLEPEMPRHLQRWGGSMNGWRMHVERLRDFAVKRPAIVLEHVKSQFGLSSEEMAALFDAWGN